MSDPSDTASMLGYAPRRHESIDKWSWGRAALNFSGFSLQEHERLARALGADAAGEVLLLVIAQKCESDSQTWKEAKDLGIPWQAKNWTFLTALQQKYNDGVAEGGDAAP